MKYEFNRNNCNKHRITVLCEALGVKRSSYYDWALRGESLRAKQNLYLLKRIHSIHAKLRDNYGAVKTWRVLREVGEQCGLHQVERLRRLQGTESKRM